MPEITLGRLERVADVREVWASEATNFTPWLAMPDNLAILGETLGLTLQLEGQERPVGPFRADLLCKDLETDSWVLIENQLERTNHGHLGQLLTYAAGLEAVTIVWIAARFTEEHRATLDWLNRITDKAFRFFGCEIELWKIGSSPAAPRFNVVAKPNDWAKTFSRAKEDLGAAPGEESPRQIAQRDYWAAFNRVLDEAGGPVLGNRKPQPQHWMKYSVGRAGCSLDALVIRPRREVRADLYIDSFNPKIVFGILQQQRAAIENELGYQLDWQRLPDRRASRVAAVLSPADPEELGDWPRQHRWLATRLNDFHRVFAQRLRAIDPAAMAEFVVDRIDDRDPDPTLSPEDDAL